MGAIEDHVFLDGTSYSTIGDIFAKASSSAWPGALVSGIITTTNCHVYTSTTLGAQTNLSTNRGNKTVQKNAKKQIKRPTPETES